MKKKSPPLIFEFGVFNYFAGGEIEVTRLLRVSDESSEISAHSFLHSWKMFPQYMKENLWYTENFYVIRRQK